MGRSNNTTGTKPRKRWRRILKRVIITLGSKFVRVYRRRGDTWIGTTVFENARDIAVDGEVLAIAADKPAAIKLRDLPDRP